MDDTHRLRHVFLSYARDDAGAVDELQKRLEAARIPVWRDVTNLELGDDWKQVIRDAIASGSFAFLCCFSTKSVAKGRAYQREEIILAVEEIRLRPPTASWFIPVRLDNCELPYYDVGAGRDLNSFNRIDLFGADRERNADRLTAKLLRIVGQNTEEPAAPTEGAKRSDEPVPHRDSSNSSGVVSRIRGHGHRRLVYTILLSTIGLLAIVIVATLLGRPSDLVTEQPKVPGCDDIGVFMEGLTAFDFYRWNPEKWTDAYNAAGGRDALGCPVPVHEQGYVHVWGRGLSQDLADANNHQTRLMALDPDHVFVMTGQYWIDYTYPRKQFAAVLQGYPTSDPVPCGEAKIVPLDQGDYAPGAMVTSLEGKYIWLPSPVWREFQRLGGVHGALGLPLSSSIEDTMDGTIDFQYGKIDLSAGKANASFDNAPTTVTAAESICPE